MVYGPQDRFNRKKLHVPSISVGITADRTIHYTYSTLQGVLITGLCSLNVPSERVSYSDCATGCKIQVVGPLSLLFKGYKDYSVRIKWLGCGVDHSSVFSGQG